MRIYETSDVHFPFIAFWLIASVLAVAWNAPPARHLVALGALAWAVLSAIGLEQGREANPTFGFVAIVSLLIGAGLLFAARAGESLREFGSALSTYGAFGLVLGVAGILAGIFGRLRGDLPIWLVGSGVAGVMLAVVAAAFVRRIGPALAAATIVLALIVASGTIPTAAASEPWLAYALALSAMLCLVVSGMLDGMRPRVVAGWIGLAAAIAAITWAVRGSLLGRAAFLAIAGLIAIALASILGRYLGRERRQ
jgi:hypothetical protein